MRDNVKIQISCALYKDCAVIPGLENFLKAGRELGHGIQAVVIECYLAVSPDAKNQGLLRWFWRAFCRGLAWNCRVQAFRSHRRNDHENHDQNQKDVD